MFATDQLLQKLNLQKLEELENKLETESPSNIDIVLNECIEEGIKVFCLPMNQVEFIYKHFEFNIIVDYQKNIFIDKDINIVYTETGAL